MQELTKAFGRLSEKDLAGTLQDLTVADDQRRAVESLPRTRPDDWQAVAVRLLFGKKDAVREAAWDVLEREVPEKALATVQDLVKSPRSSPGASSMRSAISSAVRVWVPLMHDRAMSLPRPLFAAVSASTPPRNTAWSETSGSRASSRTRSVRPLSKTWRFTVPGRDTLTHTLLCAGVPSGLMETLLSPVSPKYFRATRCTSCGVTRPTAER